jgi:hypothetical protein
MVQQTLTLNLGCGSKIGYTPPVRMPAAPVHPNFEESHSATRLPTSCRITSAHILVHRCFALQHRVTSIKTYERATLHAGRTSSIITFNR